MAPPSEDNPQNDLNNENHNRKPYTKQQKDYILALYIHEII